MKLIFIFLLFFGTLIAKEHVAKIEPLKSVTIKAQVNGEVVKALKEKEGSVVNGVIIQLDDRLNRSDLELTKESLNLIKKMIEVNKKMVEDLRKNMQKKRALYQKIAPLTSTSVSQKDSLYAAYVAAKSQLNGTIEKILNLKNQKVALEQKINLLKDTIDKKRVKVESKYLYKLYVEIGEFVTIGMPLATIMDLSKGKIILYLDAQELKGLKNKKIYIDGKVSKAKVVKVWRVADSKYLSSYKVEIEIPDVKEFSKLVKVEFK